MRLNKEGRVGACPNWNETRCAYLPVEGDAAEDCFVAFDEICGGLGVPNLSPSHTASNRVTPNTTLASNQRKITSKTKSIRTALDLGKKNPLNHSWPRRFIHKPRSSSFIYPMWRYTIFLGIKVKGFQLKSLLSSVAPAPDSNCYHICPHPLVLLVYVSSHD